MKIYIFDALALFEDHTPTKLSRALSITLPEGGELLLNGTYRYRSENGRVHISAAHLNEGENRLSLYKDGHVFLTEGLRKNGMTVTPLELSADEILRALLRVQRQQEAHLASMEKTIRQNEAEKNKRTLFT